MPIIEGAGNELPPIPAVILGGAIDAARTGEMPPFDTAELLAMLRLDGDEPDGLGMLERVTRTSEPRVSSWREVRSFSEGVIDLIELTNERTANDAQEAIAKSLGQVVTKQITREGDICLAASFLASESTREDIISPEVKQQLDSQEDKEEFGDLTDFEPDPRVITFIRNILGGLLDGDDLPDGFASEL